MQQKKMNPGPQRKITWALALSALAFLAAGYVTFFMPGAPAALVTDLVAIGTALLATALLLFFLDRKGEPMADERTRKINHLASSYSWWLSYVFIAILMLLEQFRLAALDVESVLGLTFFFMVFSQLAMRAYLDWKGDAE